MSRAIMALGDVIDYPYTYPPTRLNFQHSRLRTPSTHEFKLCTQLTKGDNEIALKKSYKGDLCSFFFVAVSFQPLIIYNAEMLSKLQTSAIKVKFKAFKRQ